MSSRHSTKLTPTRLAGPARRAGRHRRWGLLGVGAVALVVLRMVGRVGLVFPPLVVAGIEVALLEPVASWLGRRGLSRRWSVVGRSGSSSWPCWPCS